MRLNRTLFLALLLAGSAFAKDIKIVGTIEQPLHSGKQEIAQVKVPLVKLMKMELSAKAQKVLGKRASSILSQPNSLTAATGSNLPRQVQLGMNDVPVLNQGNHGSCVTFASSAAIDAALKKGDYISQLCQLELGRYLENNAYMPSGWDGSFGRLVLNQMLTHGIVSKDTQRTVGCGGLTEYPIDGFDPTAEMSVADFHQLSENLTGDENAVVWTPILDVFDAFLERTDTSKTLNQVKTTLNAGDRVTFGVLLPALDMGLAGAVGKYHSENDAWVFTPEIARDMVLNPMLIGGHEMVITGYDDGAIAIDDHGRKHHGLLTLRNSWSERVGDNGDFYMSYDYFKVLVNEAQRIRGFSNEMDQE